MKRKINAIALAVFVCLLSTGCGMKMMAKGRVVDAVTGRPVEGAAVAIHWVHQKFAPPGLGSNDEDIGTNETLTDSDGDFTIPRYLNRSYYMGVYKNGYICWNSEDIFNPHGKTYKEIFQKRYFSITNGMSIHLQPMPNDISFKQRLRHANFTLSVETRLWTFGDGPFEKAIRDEKELYIKNLKRETKEK